ncbi:winged helix-turn-helix transcriptional regulator [Streptomyces filamentosus]|uniref:winged helix-turn-helix transcriptional regulator n=1 Tax=Streptomyces filamentosus TaxID=67294 RepID=UPI0036EE4469
MSERPAEPPAERPAEPTAERPGVRPPDGERPPIRVAFDGPDCGDDAVQPFRVGDKWTGHVLRCLEDGAARRFGELRAALPWITPKVLTETLRSMERSGFLARTAYEENPPRVEYALTPLGRSLFGPLDAACSWARAHGTAIGAARSAYAGDGPAAYAGDSPVA